MTKEVVDYGHKDVWGPSREKQLGGSSIHLDLYMTCQKRFGYGLWNTYKIF